MDCCRRRYTYENWRLNATELSLLIQSNSFCCFGFFFVPLAFAHKILTEKTFSDESRVPIPEFSIQHLGNNTSPTINTSYFLFIYIFFFVWKIRREGFHRGVNSATLPHSFFIHVFFLLLFLEKDDPA